MCGILDGWQTYCFGSQGWEFLELGRIWQDLLLADFDLWVLILFRGMGEHVAHPRGGLLWLPCDGLLPLLRHRHDPEDELQRL